MNDIQRVLVATRGEIAVRVIQACMELGIETVAAVSEVDRDSLPAKLSGHTVCIGPSRPEDSYLKVEAIVAAALGTGSDAIHPGYGFLSENPQLPEMCAEYGITFIGATKDNIKQMGDKVWARKAARQLGAPVIPGSEEIRDLKEARAMADDVGYPVLLKAASGGGGRGIAVVRRPEDMRPTFDVASAEARAAFGDERLYLERFILNARHIEVQIMADQLGNVVQLGERDCSLQRRHQKILEEAPSPVITAELRKTMSAIAAAIARQINYEGVGTLEFLLDLDTMQFYFMEMNTRIQVEHPVTEMVTGIDLVKEQIRIAAHYPLSLSQSEVTISGHAIECRINAESADEEFRPAPGRIGEWSPPQARNIRVDSHCYPGYYVPPYYDSLLAKVITKGSSRAKAIERMKHALANFSISGLETTLPFHRLLLEHSDYIEGDVNTRWVEDVFMAKAET